MSSNTVHPVAQLRKDVRAALPTLGIKETDQERMQSVLMIAVERDPELVQADRQSLIAAVRQCANQGLVPDGNEATLQVYNTKISVNGKDQWIKKVQYQPMVRGIINRVQKSGKVLSFWAEVVYEGETFEIDTSTGERKPIHKIANQFMRGDDSKIVGAYSVAKLKNGTIDCETMPLSEINKVRGVAKTKKVWDSWFSEKAKVAVLRRHSKRLPLSAEDLDMILNRQETDFDQPVVRDITPTPKEGGFASIALKAREAAQATDQSFNEEDTHTLDGEVLPSEEGKAPAENQGSESGGAIERTFEFDEGATAFRKGEMASDCPYDGGVQLRDWRAGWSHEYDLANPQEEDDQ